MPAMSDTEYRDFVTAGSKSVKGRAVLRASTLNARGYVGAQRAQEYGRLNAGKGMLLVRITPEKVVSENIITGEQEQATIMSTGRR
jgi:hypothetical protein